MSFYLGLDLGQAMDYSAITIVEQIPGTLAGYNIRWLERMKLGTPYPAVASRVLSIMGNPDLKGRTTLIVDATGVGKPVVDSLRSMGASPVGVYIHGGDKVSKENGSFRVPKRDLVGIMQVLLQGQRLRIANALPEAKTLMQELLSFRVRIDPVTAHDSYSAWREGQHDDLVLATALACWYPERSGRLRVWA